MDEIWINTFSVTRNILFWHFIVWRPRQTDSKIYIFKLSCTEFWLEASALLQEYAEKQMDLPFKAFLQPVLQIGIREQATWFTENDLQRRKME